jgi:hypothetical protein
MGNVTTSLIVPDIGGRLTWVERASHHRDVIDWRS